AETLRKMKPSSTNESMRYVHGYATNHTEPVAMPLPTATTTGAATQLKSRSSKKDLFGKSEDFQFLQRQISNIKEYFPAPPYWQTPKNGATSLSKSAEQLGPKGK